MIYVNGRFLTQPMSGVQRYAREMLDALDDILDATSDPLGPVAVLIPIDVETPPWRALRLRVVRGGRGHLWEQTTLARAARGGVLVSLGNSGPVVHPRHIVCLHDAHLYDMPKAFSGPYRAWHSAIRPVLARRASRLITVSSHSAKRLAHHLRIEERRFTVLPNSADHILRQPADVSVPTRYGLKSGGYFLSVGNQSPNKNLAALVRAHGAVGPDVPPLAVVGGSASGVTTAKAGAGQVHLVGRVPDADLRGLYEGAAAFVFPSLNEGFGIPPLEAMQLGVPVLCARSGAMPDVLGQAPLWFDPRDERDMTRVLRDFMALSDGERDILCKTGWQVAARYSWRRSAQGLANCITALSNPPQEGLQLALAADLVRHLTRET